MSVETVGLTPQPPLAVAAPFKYNNAGIVNRALFTVATNNAKVRT